jgi:photosystem II stability/assembly factor-like uncharacterized protein
MMTDELESDVRQALAACAAEVPADVGERIGRRDFHPRGWRRPMAGALAVAVVALATGVVVLTTGAAPSGSHGTAAIQRPTARSWRLVSEVNPSTWQQPPTSGYQSGLDLTCPTATTCYVEDAPSTVGSPAQIEVTHDAGSTWQQAALPGDVTLPVTGLDCVEAATCVTVAGDGTGNEEFVTTDDGGQTWTSFPAPANLPSAFSFSSVSCTTPTVCVAVGWSGGGAGPAGLALITTDGGAGWSESELPAGFVPVQVRCFVGGRCLATGGGGGPQSTQGEALYSADGGSTWLPAAVPPDIGTMGAVTCGDAAACLATVAGGDGPTASNLVATTDSGMTWARVPAAGLPTSVVLGMSCATSSYCWSSGALMSLRALESGSPVAVGNDQVKGLLAMTHDQGQSWQTVAVPPSLDVGPVPAISCPDSTTCFALGYQRAASGPATFVLLSYES